MPGINVLKLIVTKNEQILELSYPGLSDYELLGLKLVYCHENDMVL